jgi:hypothetical protein
MGQFRHFLNYVSLKEIHLNGHLFTWSNERSHPTLEQIDRAFASNDWNNLFLNHAMQSLSSLYSDHVPLLLSIDDKFCGKKRFHFRSFWPTFEAFLEVMERAWHCSLRDVSPFRRLDWLLQNTARALTS